MLGRDYMREVAEANLRELISSGDGQDAHYSDDWFAARGFDPEYMQMHLAASAINAAAVKGVDPSDLYSFGKTMFRIGYLACEMKPPKEDTEQT